MRDLYSYSISVLRVAILFLTFSFGLWTVTKLNGFLLSEVESGELSETVRAIPISDAPDRDLHPLVIEYDCSVIGGDSSNAIFTATNVGSEIVYFNCTGDQSCQFDVVLTDAFSKSSSKVTAQAFARELAPGESAVLSVNVPLNRPLHDLFFSFRFGKNGWHRDDYASTGAEIYECNISTPPHEQ